MKKYDAIRMPLLGIALSGCLTGLAQAGDAQPYAQLDSALSGSSNSAAAPVMLAQVSNVTSPNAPIPPASGQHMFVPPLRGTTRI